RDRLAGGVELPVDDVDGPRVDCRGVQLRPRRAAEVDLPGTAGVCPRDDRAHAGGPELRPIIRGCAANAVEHVPVTDRGCSVSCPVTLIRPMVRGTPLTV